MNPTICEQYKGYFLRANAILVGFADPATRTWRRRYAPCLKITRHREANGILLEKALVVPHTHFFLHRDDSVQAALNFGRDVIDGKVHGTSVEDI